LKKQFEETVGTCIVPSGEDELWIYNLSEAIWGEKAKEAIAAASQIDSTAAKSKKGRSKKEKVDGNSKGGTLKEVTNYTQKGGKLQGNAKEELIKDAKIGTSKETTTTATQNGGSLTKRKRGEMDKDKMDIDLMPKDVSNSSQNDDTRTEEETHEEETEKGASLQDTHRSFNELQKLYPNLAWCVERIEAQYPCGETLKRAFGFIGDEKANSLESKIISQRLSGVKEQIHQADLKKVVLNRVIGLVN
jgi:hypothetical protein